VFSQITAPAARSCSTFERDDWDHASDLADIWAIGSSDPDPKVANAFLGAAGAYLRVAPTEAVPVLLDKDISEHAAAAAIEGASNYDGNTYGSGLARDDAEAVLRLVARAGYRNHPVQTTVSGIASNHPGSVLDHLAEQEAAGVRLPDDIRDLGTAFDRRPNDLADWIVRRLTPEQDEQQRLGRVLGAATNEQLTEAQGTAFAARIPELDGADLLALCRALSYLDTWPLRHPGLATGMTERARETECYPEVRDSMQARMHPNRWGGWNGESPEFGAALARARVAAAQVTDEHLRADYERATDQIEGTINDDRRRHEEDTENGWE
jgi:hypothetical protein